MNAPSKAMELKAAISAVLAGMTAFWGWTGWLVVIWLVAMVLDYATGSWAALRRDGQALPHAVGG